MKIDIILTAADIQPEKIKDKIVVIIDVLRATSVMITALANGAKAVYPYKDIESVLENSKKSKSFVLGGERKGLKIEGFDFGNSPLEYTKEAVSGKDMFMTTSNGTRAIENSANGSKKLFIAAFLNVESVAKKILEENDDTVIICSGTDNNFSLDDALCAGEIIRRVKEKNRDIQLTDISLAMKRLAETSLGIEETLEGSKHFEYLKTIGFYGDMNHCFTMDMFDIVPEYKNGVITK
ncbi:2-phosphosulfolactate phosphatase [Fusobacterium ulcerans]|jgi:2-phosphosulfolactate phosphatase|uniref:Probable 2-phosphosulfolactate phosphatase n=1 Tax=Fusobacterium ulcerans TaxID=861 RepID=A0AAX2JA31_9FUSO|nr:2-phosphosulfolactate phosphatase [Fusobacterium ulcerans]AVQ29137.1 2-phosphosulfolactate phosphatase [Fusobacterium ulcerans]EFS26607.1 2-phosphosulfolactate phosphatase [Fusobacterium ulcerans ATCC 49185]MCB8564126.1 2-phosphosulfolactate phosphatase [Fusobacterium ulcerans]MCB8648455.1 2-phosphosulfolactate phosphatase [Fusobacterium ulcerans]MEE0139515.1 2-phosphosulfolactate phosphatase [Fusobacterium ulcerans]